MDRRRFLLTSLRTGVKASVLLALLALGGWSRSVDAQPWLGLGWEPARWQDMGVAADNARKTGDLVTAERICVTMLEYVEENTVRNLGDYASLLETLNRPEAETARARSNKLRDVRRGGRGGYLGFAPPDELMAYGTFLKGLGRRADAEAVAKLAEAEDAANRAHYRRSQLQSLGRDWRGTC